MVEQVIKYSDGTETVIKYRGVIENGVLTPDAVEESAEAPVAEAVEAPVEEAPVVLEAPLEKAPVSEETPN